MTWPLPHIADMPIQYRHTQMQCRCLYLLKQCIKTRHLASGSFFIILLYFIMLIFLTSHPYTIWPLPHDASTSIWHGHLHLPKQHLKTHCFSLGGFFFMFVDFFLIFYNQASLHDTATFRLRRHPHTALPHSPIQGIFFFMFILLLVLFIF